MSRRKYKAVRVQRQSGLPVNIEDLENYKNEWRIKFDTIFNDNKSNMPECQKLCDIEEAKLFDKYPTVQEWEWMTSQKDWREKTTEFGMISVNYDVNGIAVYMIMDDVEL